MSDSLLAQRQQQFMHYLMEGDTAIAEAIVTQGNVPVETRLHIYRNAYCMRFKETIETDHEILGFYLGDTLFDEMVKGYIQTCPSHSYSLRHFADKLPQYLSATKPFSEHPIISELAAFERMLLSAFDAGEANRMAASQLAEIPPEQWPELQLTFHPSMQIFHASWNSVEAWQVLKAKQSPVSAKQQQAAWLLWCNAERLTEFESINVEEYKLIDKALKGCTFSVLCDKLLEHYEEEEAGQVAVQYLLKWMEKGLLTTR